MRRISRRSIVVALYCLATLCPGLAHSQSDPITWREVRAEVSALQEQGLIDEALGLLETRGAELKDHEFEVSDLALEILFGAGRVEEALSVWEAGLDDGYFYFVVPRMALYDSVRETERFGKDLARNNHLRDKASRKSKPEFKVITPAGYSSKGSYPLLMVIHGGNQSIVKAMQRWQPQVIGDGLIIAYVQSSNRADTKSYRWDLGGVDIYHMPTAQQEVLGLYKSIVEKYAVDTTRVTLAGFSQGGNLALIMAAEGTIPARGFIAGCPAMRSPVLPEDAQASAERGLLGTIFVGENDWTAEAVSATVANFNAAGLPINHIVMEGKGHEYPDDFEDVLRGAVKQIYQ